MQLIYRLYIISCILLVIFINNVQAGNVEILAAELHNTGSTSWLVRVTLKHQDKGWEHYADNWQIVDGNGKVLGDRILYHPHVDEQPFTRSLSNVNIPANIRIIYITAHDKIHGWTANRLKIDLRKVKENRLKVEKM
jgi:hypothetical protein